MLGSFAKQQRLIRYSFTTIMTFAWLWLALQAAEAEQTLASGLLSLLALATLLIFASPQLVRYRRLYPALVIVVLAILLPLAQSLALSFSNYSANHRLNYSQARENLLQRTYKASGRDQFAFRLVSEGGQYRVILSTQDKPTQHFQSPPLNLLGIRELREQQSVKKLKFNPTQVQLSKTEYASLPEPVSIRELVRLRHHLAELEMITPEHPENAVLVMTGLRKYQYQKPVFVEPNQTLKLANGRELSPKYLLYDQQRQVYLFADLGSGFFRRLDSQGKFVGEPVTPGFISFAGLRNYHRLFNDDGLHLGKVTLWHLTFSICVALTALVIGSYSALLLSSQRLRGRGLILGLLLTPLLFPLPLIASIGKGFFGQYVGELNLLLELWLGIKPAWFTETALARSMQLILATVASFPWVLLLVRWLLLRAPSALAKDVSQAKLSRPLLRYLAPNLTLIGVFIALLISGALSFIRRLNDGSPSIIGASVDVGHSDTLNSVAYKTGFYYAYNLQELSLAASLNMLLLVFVLIPLLWACRKLLQQLPNDDTPSKDSSISPETSSKPLAAETNKRSGLVALHYLWLVPLCAVALCPLVLLIYLSLREGQYIPSMKFNLDHWRLSLGFLVHHSNGSITPPPFPVLSWLAKDLIQAIALAVVATPLALLGASTLARLGRKSRMRLMLLGLLVFLIPSSTLIIGHYQLAEQYLFTKGLLYLSERQLLLLCYLPITLMLTVAAYWGGVRSLRRTALMKQAKLITLLFIAAMLFSLSETCLAYVLLQDVDDLSLLVGLEHYLYPNNFLWGDFAAAALIYTLPYGLLVIGLLKLMDSQLLAKPKKEKCF